MHVRVRRVPGPWQQCRAVAAICLRHPSLSNRGAHLDTRKGRSLPPLMATMASYVALDWEGRRAGAQGGFSEARRAGF